MEGRAFEPRSRQSEGEMHRVGRLEDFPAGECVAVEVPGREICIVNVDGELHAIRDVCPHRGAKLSKGEVRGTMLPTAAATYSYGHEGRVLVCPWHRWQFDVTTGEALFGIHSSRLPRYRVSVVAEDVFVGERIK